MFTEIWRSILHAVHGDLAHGTEDSVVINMTLFRRCRRDHRVAGRILTRPLPHLPGCFRSSKSEGESNEGKANNWSNKNERPLVLV